MKASKEELRSKIHEVISKANSGDRLYAVEKENLANAIAEEIHQQDHPIFDHPWYYPGREYLGIIDEVVQENFPGHTTCLSDNADTKISTWSISHKGRGIIDSHSICYGYIEPDQVNSEMHRWRVGIMKSVIAAGISMIIQTREVATEPCDEAAHSIDINEARIGRIEFLLGELFGIGAYAKYDSIIVYKKKHLIKELAEILIK